MDPIKEHLGDLPAKAKKVKTENKAFFKKLKKVKLGVLDAQFQEVHEEVFEKTDCLTCANCCKTTGPLFTQKDVERIAKHFRLRPAEFIDKYLHHDEDYDLVLNSLPCPFLNDDNYCGIYEVRPKACHEYPHTDMRNQKQILALTAKNAEICPAVFEMVERMKSNAGL